MQCTLLLKVAVDIHMQYAVGEFVTQHNLPQHLEVLHSFADKKLSSPMRLILSKLFVVIHLQQHTITSAHWQSFLPASHGERQPLLSITHWHYIIFTQGQLACRLLDNH